MVADAEPESGVRRGLAFNVRRDLAFFSIVGLIFVADQLLKWYIGATFGPGDYWPSRDWPVRIAYETNSGAAFGILQGQAVFLVASTVIGLGAILLYYFFPPLEHGILRLALSMMLGGAVGNLVDRVRQGFVVDFIDTDFWPTFNFADSCISIGMVVLIGFLLLKERKAGAQAEQADARAP